VGKAIKTFFSHQGNTGEGRGVRGVESEEECMRSIGNAECRK